MILPIHALGRQWTYHLPARGGTHANFQQQKRDIQEKKKNYVQDEGVYFLLLLLMGINARTMTLWFLNTGVETNQTKSEGQVKYCCQRHPLLLP